MGGGTVKRVLLVLGLIVGLIVAFYCLLTVERALGISLPFFEFGLALFGGAVVGGAFGFLVAPRIILGIIQVTSWLENRLQRMPIQDLVSGAIGLVVGLVIASLLGSALARIPWVGGILPTVGSVILGYLGLSVGLRKREELLSFLSQIPRPGKERQAVKGGVQPQLRSNQPKILDTSVIIDGRIADICQSGFIEGPVIVPGFVLEELRHIADSSDTLKRNRGRRGLDVLNKLQKELGTNVQVYERDPGNGLDVDAKLVRLARSLEGKIVTNDYNLNKVAQLHGVTVLNINELANALKPVVLPGEEMSVHVIRDGKESGQGIAYLDDGTMIVVDGGKRHIGETIWVSVTSVLQTAAGRMIFARPKGNEERAIEKAVQ